MKRLLMTITTFCSLLYASQNPVAVTLSGTVKDKAGAPVKGVNITLAKIKDLSTKTGDDGTFTLSNKTSIFTTANMKTSYGITFKNNTIVFSSISDRITGTMSLYSGDGRLISSVSLDNLHAGQQCIALPELSTGMYLLKATVDGESFTRSLVCMENAHYLGNESVVANDNGSLTLRKENAAAIADTLIASIDSYDTTRYALTSYSKTNIEIVMNKKGAGGFSITSTAFKEGDKMPDKYTCQGKTFTGMTAPPLAWSGAPSGTKSYAMTFLDVTILATTDPAYGYHWAMWNIPSTVTQLAEGFAGTLYMQKSAVAAMAGGSNKFFGPCPGKKDTYALTLYTFDEETVNPGNNPDVKALVTFFSKNATDSTKISVWSDAKTN
jgi:phosphatidylethanolamine-binding protein (PEBP) family uncharacterized protein